MRVALKFATLNPGYVSWLANLIRGVTKISMLVEIGPGSDRFLELYPEPKTYEEALPLLRKAQEVMAAHVGGNYPIVIYDEESEKFVLVEDAYLMLEEAFHAQGKALGNERTRANELQGQLDACQEVIKDMPLGDLVGKGDVLGFLEKLAKQK